MGMSTRGHELWAAFLAAVGATHEEAAKAIRVSKGLLSQFKKGQRPGSAVRDRMKRWTRGRVPPHAWDTREERDALEAVKPIARSRLRKVGAS